MQAVPFSHIYLVSLIQTLGGFWAVSVECIIFTFNSLSYPQRESRAVFNTRIRSPLLLSSWALHENALWCSMRFESFGLLLLFVLSVYSVAECGHSWSDHFRVSTLGMPLQACSRFPFSATTSSWERVHPSIYDRTDTFRENIIGFIFL